MRKYYPIVFRFRESAVQSLPENLLKFYSWLSWKWLGGKWTNENADPKSLPFSNEEMLSNPYKIYSLVIDPIRSWKDSVDLFIIDLRGQFRGQLLIHVGSALKNLFREIEALPKQVQVMILLNEMPPEEDAFLREIVEAIRSNKVIMFDNKGNCIFEKHLKHAIPKDEFQFKLLETEDNPLDLLKIKIIRRLGHFKHEVNGKHFSCHRYFHDGSKCAGEIADFIEKKILKHGHERRYPLVLYYSPITDWLPDALTIVHMRLGNPFEEVRYAISGGFIESESTIIFVIVMINSGKSFLHYYNKLKETNPKINIIPYAILATNISARNSVRTISDGSTKVDIECFMPVRQEEYKHGKCEMCDLKLPWTNRKDEDYDMLSSYDFWDMCNEAGFKEEEDPPEYREPIKTVPDFPEMIKKHGSWLVYKIEKFLKSQEIACADLVVVCPEEKFPTIYANYLKLLLNATVIQIPRPILKTLIDASSDISTLYEDWQVKKPLWFEQLESLRTSEIILFDEFNKSGETLKAMQKLADHFNKNILCYFPLVNFNPSYTTALSIPFLSLYSFAI